MRTVLIILFVFVNLTIGRSQERHWSTPDYLVLQYAGSIGYLSGGVGYNVFKDRARASLHFGHVPKTVGGPLNIFATKLMVVPRRPYRLSDRSTLSPFDFGLMVSYHLGEDFRSTWPEHRYPERYYWWQTSFRLHLNYQPSVTIKIRDHTTFKAVSGYLELNTNELYLISLFQNLHALRVWDVMKLGAGMRLHF
jgi:hypothetical protein